MAWLNQWYGFHVISSHVAHYKSVARLVLLLWIRFADKMTIARLESVFYSLNPNVITTNPRTKFGNNIPVREITINVVLFFMKIYAKTNILKLFLIEIFQQNLPSLITMLITFPCVTECFQLFVSWIYVRSAPKIAVLW